jgi:hypothetical protein
MTLNQIIARIQIQAERHKQVGKFGVGQQSELTVENIEFYPLVWLYPNGFNLDLEGKMQSYNFVLLVMDRVFEDQSNTMEVLSDTAQIITDIFAQLYYVYRNEDWVLNVNANASPFYDAKTDILAGYGIDFSVQVPYTVDYCDVPL